MSSSRSSSASPEPEVVTKKAKKPKDKQKKAYAAADVGEHAKNEGDDHDLAYRPPEGFVLMKHKNEEGDFDWDAINGDDNLELWVVRVPDGVRGALLFSSVRQYLPICAAQTKTPRGFENRGVCLFQHLACRLDRTETHCL